MTTKELILTDYSDKIIIEKKNSEFKTTILKNKPESNSKEQTLLMYGIYGALTLSKSSYLICVTDADSVGVYNGELVYEIKKVSLVKYKTVAEENKSKKLWDYIFEEKNDAYEIGLISKFFKMRGNYFSESNIYENNFSGGKNGFIFNYNLLNNLKKITDDYEHISLKCIFGSFVFRSMNGINFSLLSRRSRHRNGARFFNRGTDLNGYVSNFVETIQTVEFEGKQNYFVQVRGSIPLKWKHKVALKYNPDYVIEEASNSFKNSERKLKKNYGNVFYLNLTKNEGCEEKVYKEFDKQLQENKCEYLHYNIARELSLKKSETFPDLEGRLKKVIDEYGFFTEDDKQRGVIRTNCIDSTDRTNVSQYIIGRCQIRQQLKNINQSYNEEVDKLLKNLWDYNGDTLSLQYTGTLTSLGKLIFSEKNNLLGNIRDGYVSVLRYFSCRFLHGSLHNSFLLITGKKNFFEAKPKDIIRKNFGLFLLVFVFVTLFKFVLKKFKDVNEMVVSSSISAIFLSYLLYTADLYFDIPDYD